MSFDSGIRGVEHEDVDQSTDHELLIEVKTDVAVWRLRVLKPKKQNAKGRFVIVEIWQGDNYSFKPRYLSKSILDLLKDFASKVIYFVGFEERLQYRASSLRSYLKSLDAKLEKLKEESP
ncbi:MAG: hypothetical protein C0179_04055 [Fervidicoccus sp.]|nr:MAG: hypothetical protein C0179_04055 [Fervidicoccus sp.]